MVDHQADGWTHSDTRIEHVNGGGVFRVNPCSAAAVPMHATAGCPIKMSSAAKHPQEIRLLGRVNAIPDTNKAAVLDLHVELLTGHDF